MLFRFAALLLAARILFLLAGLDPAEERALLAIDPATIPWRGPERPLYDVEELYCGTAGQAIRMGSGTPLHHFQFTPYGGGSLLLALLSIPLYSWFGPNYLAFKILPLTVSLAAGVFWWSVVRAWLGERSARLFGLLYLLAPPVLVRTALIAKGDHPEAMAWIGGVLLLATRAAFAEREERRRAWAAAAGAAAGLGVWVTYSTIPVLAGIALVAAIRTRARPRGAWIASAAGFLVGLVPWLASLAVIEGRSTHMYGSSFAQLVARAPTLDRILLLLRNGFGANYDLAPSIVARAAGFVWLAAVALGWWSLARARRSPVAGFVLAGTLAHLGAWCLGAPSPGSRYLLPVYPLLMTAALWPAAVGERTGERRSRVLRLAAPAVVLIFGAWSQANVVAHSSFVALHAPLSGTHWPLLGEVLGPKLSGAQVRAFPDSAQRHLWFGIGIKYGSTLDPEHWEKAAKRAGPHASDCWEGIGFAWGACSRAENAGRDLESFPATARESLLRGLECYAETPFVRPFLASREYLGRLLASLDLESRARLERPIARSIAVLDAHTALAAAPELRGAELELLDSSARERGAGWALFRGVVGGSRLDLWTPVAGSWTATIAPGELSTASLPFVEGLAEAWEWQLSRLSPRFLVGDERGPVRLAHEVALLTERFDASRATLFWRAAGRAAARAFVDEGGPPSTWPWTAAIPPEHHAEFREGLERGATRRVPGPSL